ncbi:hypothetical protein L0668_01465 [Paraglaciecola aquimarina]|uniref:DUF6817 domain-containing protein n=1 Tax=Paraglaciecola algarum TaxID=3050085 RepID=A0ABS9D1G0_9ALTE|nr:hypothetical protein [Paraglaciecola sp. G1-23]MCF2946760.1 hypothetical protein [Paraglaciecola sp. G1-23]
MDQKFRLLIELGAGEFEHAQTYLIEYLESTRCMLKSWIASEIMQDAGLYHLAYDINATDSKLFDEARRKQVAAIVGAKAESIIYHYCACDWGGFLTHTSQEQEPIFYDRYTARHFKIDSELVHNLCELKAAIEINRVLHHPSSIQKNSERLKILFGQIQEQLSAPAQRKINQVLSDN